MLYINGLLSIFGTSNFEKAENELTKLKIVIHNCYLGTDQFQNWELSVLVLADEEFFNEIKSNCFD